MHVVSIEAVSASATAIVRASRVVIIFAIFTFVTTKLPHYTLPAFPLLALLFARGLLARNATTFLRNCAAVSAAAYLVIALVVPPLVARTFPAYQLFHQSRAYLQPNMQFGSVQFDEPSLVWYFRGSVRGFLAPLNRRSIAGFMAAPGPRVTIATPGRWFSFPSASAM